ncbi:Eco57I restriction-modification methylase domain-containing protein [Mesohalobacter halotolerans]|uniref:Eco57I restriction-modification methylase domain-containing protein n=1 Tax=Mesohalobacter halotolerans TaxID=1883405 RepID=UPI001FE2E2C6|nr:TaqI-like C-terminal specificity domain-containing protein [Mesohalobacter halotolerans]
MFSCKYEGELSERSAKKRQFEIAKKVLKDVYKDGVIFVFYDAQGNFRFSFLRRNYGNKSEKYTNWKRYTYYVDPVKQNKTFKDRIDNCNYNSLDHIQEAFSVEPLNKKFYQDIAKTFFELISGKYRVGSKTINVSQPLLELPSTPYTSNETIYKEFAVRLIGRSIFCWFLKNKKSNAGRPLMPESLLSSTAVEQQQKNYYHNVLEKLFFLILNKKTEDRKAFDLPPEANQIPFLNGGLFEAHSDDFFDNNKPNYALKIPDTWFTNFFETLEQYNFTIDENSINDSEVTIDPEMLGTIFENLLAEIDPDTEKSARKATGSFYTPREIVDYMVEQSLVQYLKTKTTLTNETALLNLFQETQEDEVFSNTEKEQILNALSSVKILDPACGSGAFPMGAVNKIIKALEQLDPDAEWWKEQQVKLIPNPVARKNLKAKLEKSTSDYARKLGVIQNSIYGVDIQPIAAEISKLRSFLSLVIDENIDDNAPNRGIEPLPNLEFKFVTANTLIGLPEAENQQLGMFDDMEELQALEELREEYLQSYSKKKQKIKDKFLKTQKKAFKGTHNLFADQNSRSYKLVSWNPFKNEPSSWFDPQWMFGIDKFDVVIGNPPYVSFGARGVGKLIKEKKELFKLLFKNSAEYKINIYALFMEKGISLLSESGVTSYIVPDSFLLGRYFSKIRNYILKRCTIQSLMLIKAEVFKSASLGQSVVYVLNRKIDKSNKIKVLLSRKVNELENSSYIKFTFPQNYYDTTDYNRFRMLFNKDDYEIIKKIDSVGEKLENYFRGHTGVRSKIGQKNIIFDTPSKKTYKKGIISGGQIHKFNIDYEGHYLNIDPNILHGGGFRKEIIENDKILIRQTADNLICAVDSNNYYHLNNVHSFSPINKKLNINYVCGVLNSRLINFYYNKISLEEGRAMAQIDIEVIEKIPIPYVNDSIQIKISNLINQITDNIEAINEEFELIIYKLYNLTYQEVLIIDPEFSLTQEEYDNYKI